MNVNVAAWSDQNLRRFGDYDAVLIDGRVWTNGALHDRACRLATALLDLGVTPGDRIVLLLPNSIELVVAFTAVMRSGAVAVPLFAGASPAELERIVRLSSPAAIVTSPELVRVAQGPAATIPTKIVGGADEDVGDWLGLERLMRSPPLESAVPREASDPAVICYTSGTSGAPKGVVYTHGSVQARHGGGTRRLAARVLIALPLGTLGAGMLTGRLAHQWTLIVLDKFDPRSFLAAIAQHRVTKLVMVPSMGEAIAALPDVGSFDLSSLRSVGFTGADVPAPLLAKLALVLPINPSIAYGMTETGGGIAASGLASKPGSVGRILKGVDIRIVDAQGQELPHGDAGEIHVRTPWMGAGYYRQPEETAAAFSDGWIRTGDLGYLDDDRELFLVGRQKDLIVQAGVKVAPREVLDVLRGLPGVEECAVVGVPHALLGEQVVACVVRRADSGIRADEILAHCRAHLDPRKVPVRVSLRDALPKTPNRKINLQELRQLVMTEQAAVVDTDLVRRLRSTASAERVALMRDAVHHELPRVLPPTSAERLTSALADRTTTFGEMGLDSLRLAQLGQWLGEALGRSIVPTLFFSHPTVDALCRHLVDVVVGAPPATVRRPTRRTAAGEPVAIIGFGCRLPGGVDTPEAYWSLLRDGVDATAEISRWNVDTLYDARRGAPGKIGTRRAALLDAPDLFDADFFGVTPRDALTLDPQHRLLLEVAWEALEHAAYDPRGLSETLAGVFLGISGTVAAGGSGLGAAPAMAVGRLCHFLDLRGPAIAVDTSCSSSLTAIHHAVQSLRLGECDVALAGGVQVIGSLRSFVGPSEMSLLASDGRCKAFDASADGFGRGEGCVVIVLKRLADAQSDRDRVIAVVRGSAVRHDGRSSSLTAPNGRAQQDVIRAALEDAEVSPADVDYLEAHGTGTPLGDPIEIEAATSVFTNRVHPLVVGSVKTNVGHLESAAGAAGLIKVALALEHGEIPAHLHCRTLNPLLDHLASSFVIPATTQPWPRTPGRGRIAGVTSMGLSGTNVHVIVEEAPARPGSAHHVRATAVPDALPPPQLLCLSARDDAALRQLAQRHADRLADVGAAAFADYCFTANAGRAHFACRLAMVAATPSAARERLLACARGTTVRTERTVFNRPLRVAFSFAGAGSPFAGIGRRLYDTEPVFRHAIERCAAILAPSMRRPLLDAFDADAPDGPRVLPLDRVELAQPALFAFEWAVAELWRSWGIEPDVAVGEGIGKCVAAAAAGLMTLADGLMLAAAGDPLNDGAQTTLAATACDVCVDIGPRSPRDREQMLEGLADLYMRGADPDWRRFYAGRACQRMALPTYPFQHVRHALALADGADGEAGATRLAGRQRNRRGHLQAPPSDQRLDTVIDAVRRQVAAVVGCSPDALTTGQDCLALGLDSLGLLDVVAAIREQTGVACTPADFVARPTIASFADYINGQIVSTRSAAGGPSCASPLVVLNDRGARTPIVCMHPSGGQATAYLRLRALLGDDQPLYACQSRALDDPAREHATIESMAAEYASLIQRVRPQGPYRLLGWSMGGLIALAVAAELERRGASIEMIGLIDAVAPDASARLMPQKRDLALALTALVYQLQPSLVGGGGVPIDLEEAGAIARTDLHAWCETRGAIPAGALSRERFDAALRLYQAHFQLVRAYRPAIVDAPIVAWRASSVRQRDDWSSYTRGGATETFVGGSHFSVMQPPHIERIAADLCLSPRADARPPTSRPPDLYELAHLDVSQTERRT